MKRAVGRPRTKIDKTQFENLCSLQCTQEEIASFFSCDPDTVQNWCKKEYGKNFSEVFKVKRGKGKISLRRMQWKLAETNATMGIWLGKQYLDQRDLVEMDINQSANETIAEVEAYIKNKDHVEDKT